MFDEEGRKITIQEFPRNFENMSIEEIEQYMLDLKEEMGRAEAEVSAKKASAAAAADIFK